MDTKRKDVISKEHEIGSINTLVDLNQDFTTFSANFKVSPSDKDQEYQISVVDQTHIDNQDIEFKTVKGDVAANVVWDKNEYKNHYIALKCKKDMKITVDIEIEEIPYVQPVEEPQPAMLQSSIVKEYEHEAESEGFFSTVYFKILVVVLIVAVGYYLYKKYYVSEKQPIVSEPRVSSPVSAPVSAPVSTPPSSPSKGQTPSPVFEFKPKESLGDKLFGTKKYYF
jgi:hypothetical protein